MAIEAKRVINGSHGEAWLDGEYISEITSAQAKINYKKEVVDLVGDLGEHQKVMGYSGTGSLEIHKVSSRMARALKNTKDGRTNYFTIILKLADPDSFGAERIVLNEVCFDDLTLADWKAKTKGIVTIPFTFASYEFIDMINI